MIWPSGHRQSLLGDVGSSGPSAVLPSSGKGSWGRHPVDRNIRTNEPPGQQTKQVPGCSVLAIHYRAPTEHNTQKQ